MSYTTAQVCLTCLACARKFCISLWLCMDTLGLRAASRATSVTKIMTRTGRIRFRDTLSLLCAVRDCAHRPHRDSHGERRLQDRFAGVHPDDVAFRQRPLRPRRRHTQHISCDRSSTTQFGQRRRPTLGPDRHEARWLGGEEERHARTVHRPQVAMAAVSNPNHHLLHPSTEQRPVAQGAPDRTRVPDGTSRLRTT